MQRAVLPALLVLGLCSGANGAEITNMLAIAGSCQNLVVDGDDFSGGCQDDLLQVTYDIGRVGLYAFVEGRIIAFSGQSDEIVDDEIHHYLDQVLVGQDAENIETVPVDGTCIYGNPYIGVAKFTCTAESPDGRLFELAFTTDGNPPVDQMAD